MTRPTRFPGRASGPAERMAGFLAHLRMNGLPAGPRETVDALAVLGAIDPLDPGEVRAALRTLLATDAESWERFDALFDAYWFNAGRARSAGRPAARSRTPSRPALWQRHLGEDAADDDAPGTAIPDDGAGEAEGTEGRRLATRTDSLSRRDLRALMDEETLRQAEAVAGRLARAIRDRRSRRRRAARRGEALDLRRVLRRSLARGGEPLDLPRRRRPERPARIVALCDVSGSMSVHARLFLAFLKGLVSADTTADAYLFHTRLLRVTPALRERDALAAAGRLSLMAEGFGGGTDIAGCLERFSDAHAARAVTSRSCVVILSDGYCTSPPEALTAALTRLRRRAPRIVWLNPLAGREGSRAMSAALPLLDAHLPADTLEALAALEGEFARL